MRLTKTLGFAGALIISALVGGTLIGTAFAQDDGDGTTAGGDTDAGAYCEAFLETFAAELGTSTDAVTAAGKVAAKAAIDSAVAAGDLTEERADALRERIDNADGDGCGLFRAAWVRGFGHGAVRGWAHGIMFGDAIEAAADSLGIGSDELIGQLREAGSLEAVAENLGADYEALKSSILAAVQADLDATNLSDERKARIMERVTNWLDEGGEVRGPHRDRGRPGRVPAADENSDGDASDT